MSIDFLESVAERVAEAKAQFAPLEKETSTNSIVKLSPLLIDAWEYRDRQAFEVGDIQSLAESIKLKGQAQPIVIVNASKIFSPKTDSKAKYIVIAGYRRWLACKSMKMDVESVIKDLSFDGAIACLVAENEKQSVSDYSRGLFFSSLLKREGTSKKIIYERLGLTKTVFNNYLAFAEIRKEIWNEVGDVTKVTARSAGVIKVICQKGELYISAIKAIGPQISRGYGEKKIKNAVDKYIASLNLNDTRVSSKNSIKVSLKKNNVNIVFQDISSELKNKFNSGLSDYVHEFIKNNKIQ